MNEVNEAIRKINKLEDTIALLEYERQGLRDTLNMLQANLVKKSADCRRLERICEVQNTFKDVSITSPEGLKEVASKLLKIADTVEEANRESKVPLPVVKIQLKAGLRVTINGSEYLIHNTSFGLRAFDSTNEMTSLSFSLITHINDNPVKWVGDITFTLVHSV